MAAMFSPAGTCWIIRSRRSGRFSACHIRCGEPPRRRERNRRRVSFGKSGPMKLRHVVLFKFSNAASPAEIGEVVRRFAALPTLVPGIDSFEWGENCSSEGLAHGHSHAFLLAFASVEARDAYLLHPDHVAFANWVRTYPVIGYGIGLLGRERSFGRLQRRERSDAMTGAVHGERRGATALWLLDNPRKNNAFDPGMFATLHRLAVEVEQDRAIRAVVVAGAGERVFCAGADIAAWGVLDPIDFMRTWIAAGHRLFDRVAALPVPVLGALRGFVFGGGLEFAAACDIRAASPDAVFGLPEATIGVMPVGRARSAPGA